jgi:soluble lytic murein transglycosylase-like protein
MQVTSNYSPTTQDDFNQQTNTSNSLENKQVSDTSNPPSVNIPTNSVVSEPSKQSTQLSNKYQQYNSLESNYFRSMLNSALPNNKTQTPSQTSTNIKSGDSSVKQPNSSTQATSTNTTDSKTETAKATNDPSKPAVKDDLDTNWDKVEKGVNQNKYNDIIRKAVEDPNNPFPEITPIELKALIWQESKFNPEAGSSRGAKGLVQIMNNTAKEGGLDINGPGEDPRFIPEKAIPASLKILDKKFDYVNNDSKNKKGEIISRGLSYYTQGKPLPKEEKLKFALASYNGGHPRVKEALKTAYGDNIPPNGPKFEDIKPYLSEETQNYVPAILKRASEK